MAIYSIVNGVSKEINKLYSTVDGAIIINDCFASIDGVTKELLVQKHPSINHIVFHREPAYVMGNYDSNDKSWTSYGRTYTRYPLTTSSIFGDGNQLSRSIGFSYTRTTTGKGTVLFYPFLRAYVYDHNGNLISFPLTSVINEVNMTVEVNAPILPSISTDFSITMKMPLIAMANVGVANGASSACESIKENLEDDVITSFVGLKNISSDGVYKTLAAATSNIYCLGGDGYVSCTHSFVPFFGVIVPDAYDIVPGYVSITYSDMNIVMDGYSIPCYFNFS